MGKFKDTVNRFKKEMHISNVSEEVIRQNLANQIILDQLFGYNPKDSDELAMSQEQEDRIDEIYNACYDFCKVLTQKEDLDWSMYSLGEIVDTACRMLLIDPNLGVDKIYFPSYVNDEDTDEEVIEDYITSDDFEYGEF